ncbi:MAG: hypothetical protein JW910_20035, partial [Anaerolineae bacterium]|nr:hypothetical protein [Anaerolineae bacterium]
AALAYRRAVRDDHPADAHRALIGFGLAAGFGVTHHASLIFPGGVLALAMLAACPALLRQVRLWGQAVLAALLGVLPWLYLLARGAAGARLAPDNLATWDGLWQHVLARGFAGDMFYYHALPDVLDRLGLMGQVLNFQWHGLILLLALAGLLLLLWRDRWLALALGGALAVHTFVAATYRAPQTVEYMIPAYVCLAVGTGWAVGEVRRMWPGVQWSALPAALLAVGIVWSGWPTWISLRAYQQRYTTTGQAQTVLAAAPADSIILANWHQATPLWTVQAVAGLRSDVDVRYVAPAGEEPILDTWIRLISEADGTRPLITCTFFEEAFRATGLTFSALGPCWLVGVAATPPADAPTATFDDNLALYVADLPDALTLGEQTNISLTWAVPGGIPADDLTTFVHLADADGRVWAQDDQSLAVPDLDGPGLVRQGYTLFVPRTVPPGEYRLLSGVYRTTPDGPVPLPNAAGEERTEIGLITVHASPVPPVTARALHTPYHTADTSLILTGYDYDRSLPGRARLYLHWQVVTPTAEALPLILWAGEHGLAAGTIPVVEAGFVTTAHDLPDDAVNDGITLTVGPEGAEIAPRLLWGLPGSTRLSLSGPRFGERYLMVGDVVITAYTVEMPAESGADIFILLTMRSLNAVTQDMSTQLALGPGNRVDGTPVGGTIPTLKWGWGATITDTLRVPWPGDDGSPPIPTLIFYDAFTGQAWPVFDPVLGQHNPVLTLTP